MAYIHYRSQEAVRNISKGYYDEIKNFSRSILYDVMVEIEKEYNDSNGRYFPGPQELKSKCIAKASERSRQKQDDYYQSEAYRRACESLLALQARREFYELITRKCSELEKTGKHRCGEMLQVDYMIGQVLIAEPHVKQKAFEKGSKHDKINKADIEEVNG